MASGMAAIIRDMEVSMALTNILIVMDLIN